MHLAKSQAKPARRDDVVQWLSPVGGAAIASVKSRAISSYACFSSTFSYACA